MFERPKSGEKAVLVHMDVSARPDLDELTEFHDLARSAGALAVGSVIGARKTPDARFYIGLGKVAELKALVDQTSAELVIFNHALSPSQERNLEKELACRVVDRTGLILDIFAQRARSFEGKLQVELAQLQHLSTRLVRGWTHLERQKGGIGLRGPGETQLETDRRLLNKRIAQLDRRLEKVSSQRNQGRKSRNKAEIPTVSWLATPMLVNRPCSTVLRNPVFILQTSCSRHWIRHSEESIWLRTRLSCWLTPLVSYRIFHMNWWRHSGQHCKRRLKLNSCCTSSTRIATNVLFA